MSYDSVAQQFTRTPIWSIQITLGECQNTFSLSPCTASGTPCYYSYFTCRDKPNYLRGTITRKFCMNDGPMVEGHSPQCRKIGKTTQEIDPKEYKTKRARLTVEMMDEKYHPQANSTKNQSYANAESAGTYWRNLIKRTPNYKWRPIKIWSGFDGLAEDDWVLYFQGVLDNIEISKTGVVKIIAKDTMTMLKKKIPQPISSENVLTIQYAGGATMNVSSAIAFLDPSNFIDGLGIAYIEDDDAGEEYVTYTGRDLVAAQLTGCTPGKYGTSPVTHAVDKKVRQATPLMKDDGTRWPPDRILMELLCHWGDVPFNLIDYVDEGITLSETLGAAGTTMTVSSVTELDGDGGVLKIGDEAIPFSGITGSVVTGMIRGAMDTAAAEHASASQVLITRFQQDFNRWLAGASYKRKVTNPIQIRELINKLREETLLHVWQKEDASITGRMVAPPYYTTTPHELTDANGIVDGSVKVDENESSRSTRIRVLYNPNVENPGKNRDNYDGEYPMIDEDIESADAYDEVSEKIIYASFVTTEFEARLIAARHMARYRRGNRILTLRVELKDYDMKVGDFAFITTRQVVDDDGTPLRVLYEILKKTPAGDNEYELVSIDTAITRRYPVISPASVTEDYDDADLLEQGRYGWIGDSKNEVGTPLVDGYYMY